MLMKTWKTGFPAIVLAGAMMLMAFAFNDSDKAATTKVKFERPKGCVYRTLFGEESSDAHAIYKTPEKVQVAVDRGQEWVARAQQTNGGWGAGSHHRQQIMDPHAVPADPSAGPGRSNPSKQSHQTSVRSEPYLTGPGLSGRSTLGGALPMEAASLSAE